MIGQGKKRGCWSFFLLVFAFLAPFSFSGYGAFELEAHKRFTLRVFFSHLPPPPPHFFVSLITLLIHKDGTSTTNARVYNETDIVARVLLVERSHFRRRGGITLVVLGAIDRFCRSWRRRRRTRRRRPNASSFFLLVGDRSNERRGKQTIP